MIKREDIIEFSDTLPFTSHDCPFDGDFESTVLRHSDTGKWFGLLYKAPCVKVGVDRSGETDILNLKCDPILTRSLFESFDGIVPAYHMNKTLWISVVLEKPVPFEEVKNLIKLSYVLTLPKSKRKKYEML